MEVFTQAESIAAYVRHLRQTDRRIGFVPTMGALHAGHLSLLNRCRAENDTTVASIFVNPTQFNDPGDLARYPRMPEQDVAKLEQAGCHALFMPGEQEIYPEPDKRVFDFGGLDRVMEGAHRPGHFNGVAQVVTRLFDLVSPHRAYFGLKDYQQLAVIRKVVADLDYPVQIIPCDIVREPDGLAMSSRNMLLNSDERRQAAAISQTLFRALELASESTVDEVKVFVSGSISSYHLLKPEYFEIVDGASLMPVSSWHSSGGVVGCLAVWAGRVRLIDNIKFSS